MAAISFFGLLQRAGQLGARRQEDEPLPSVAGNEIRRARQRRRQCLRDLTQAGIACRVPVEVVVGLEPVYIHDGQRQLA